VKRGRWVERERERERERREGDIHSRGIARKVKFGLHQVLRLITELADGSFRFTSSIIKDSFVG